jgi:hypothetical protein
MTIDLLLHTMMSDVYWSPGAKFVQGPPDAVSFVEALQNWEVSVLQSRYFLSALSTSALLKGIVWERARKYQPRIAPQCHCGSSSRSFCIHIVFL